MPRLLLLFALLAAAPHGWAQCTFSTTAGQTQSIHDVSCIELGDNFSSTSEIEISITPSSSRDGQWANAHWGFANNSTSVPATIFIGIHTSVLPDGMVLSWQGHNDNQYATAGSAHPGTDMYRWDPSLNRLVTPIFHVDWTNAFCTGHSFLADGKLLVTGGHDRTFTEVKDAAGNVVVPGYIRGLRHATTYNYATDPNAIRPGTAHDPLSWQSEQNMVRNRWYPTNTTLSDGDVLTTSGETEPTQILPDNQRFPERWHNGSWTSLTSAPKSLPTYPWMFQAPNGKVFYAGPGPDSKYLDPDGTGAWTEMGTQGRTYNRGQGTAAMFWPGKILAVGGSNGSSVTNTAEIIDLTSGAAGPGGYQLPVITAAAPMRHARHHANSTILPDGTVLVTGGSRVTSASDPNQGELEAEIWTPPAPDASGAPGPGPGTWTPVASMREARMYHSTAVLLPDGRVLSAGGEEDIKYDPFVPNVNNHCTAEIYSPPYLFRGPRPVISYSPPRTSYHQDFTIDTPTPAAVDAISWVRLSSVTHSFNMNQRYLRFPVSSRTATSVTASGPVNAETCPPGHYLVFALSNGVPSEAKIVSISENPCLASVSLSTSLINSSCSATAEAVASGSNTSTGYHWYIDGVYEPAYDGQASVSIPLDNCRRQVTFAVEVTPSCGGYVLTDSRSVTAAPFQQNGQFCLCP